VAGKLAPRKLVNGHGGGMDSKGNLDTANRPGANGSTMLKSYAPDGNLNWQRECHIWIDALALHPSKPSVMYGSDVKFKIDWSKSEGRQWDATAVTVNRHAFPDDPRIRSGGGHGQSGERGATYGRKLGDGKLLQYQSDMGMSSFEVYRFNKEKHGEIAVIYRWRP
jgi:hypothetical protein